VTTRTKIEWWLVIIAQLLEAAPVKRGLFFGIKTPMVRCGIMLGAIEGDRAAIDESGIDGKGK